MIVIFAKIIILGILAIFSWAFIQAWRRTKRRSRALWRAKYREEVVKDIISVFLTLRPQVHPDFPVPVIEPTEQGSVRLSWSSTAHYAEIEVWPNGNMEWMVYDRVRDQHQTSKGVEKQISILFLDYITSAFAPKKEQPSP